MGLFTRRWGVPGRVRYPPSRGQKNKARLRAVLQYRGAGVRFLEVVVAHTIKEFEQRCPKLTSRKRRKIDSRTHMYFFMKASRVVLRGVWFREEPFT